MATADTIELLHRPALEQAALVGDGQVTPRELTEASLARIEALDDRVNAFIHVDAEGALAAADRVRPGEQPFAGVPFAVKNNHPVAGLPLTFASDLFGDTVSDHDSHMVRRAREAGFVIVGVTNLPEMGIMPVTNPRRTGATRNPWDLDRTPGGSSGGSAAAVASGMVTVAHGNDGGGSLRIPAACCGLVGLKPSRGRISFGPDMGDSFFGVEGAITRTVADAAAVLDVLAGYEPGDATWAPAPSEPFAATVARDPGRLRIAFTTASPLDTEVDPVCVQAARDAAELLESLGHHVEEVAPPWAATELAQLFTTAYAPFISMQTMVGAMLTGREPSPELVEPLTWAFWERAQDESSLELLGAIALMQRFARTNVEWFEGWDLLLTPSLGQRPVGVGEHDPCGEDPWAEFRKGYAFTPFTAPLNVSGQPAISLPLHHGDDGLPTGVQLVGRPVEEGTILAVAAQLERARPWADRRPELD